MLSINALTGTEPLLPSGSTTGGGDIDTNLYRSFQEHSDNEIFQDNKK